MYVFSSADHPNLGRSAELNTHIQCTYVRRWHSCHTSRWGQACLGSTPYLWLHLFSLFLSVLTFQLPYPVPFMVDIVFQDWRAVNHATLPFILLLGLSHCSTNVPWHLACREGLSCLNSHCKFHTYHLHGIRNLLRGSPCVAFKQSAVGWRNCHSIVLRSPECLLSNSA